MLKGIPTIISPGLMKTLMGMGHGDEIVFADGNFPAAALDNRLLRADGLKILELLQAIIPYFPLDHRVERPAAIMAMLPGEQAPAVWKKYAETIHKYESHFSEFDAMERFAFYERSKHAYAVIATSDFTPRGNLILKKGVVRESDFGV